MHADVMLVFAGWAVAMTIVWVFIAAISRANRIYDEQTDEWENL